MTMHFEDLAIGDSYRFGSYTVSQGEMIAFAKTFDPQSFHVDPEAAEESIFGGLVASGLYTLCLATRLTVEEFFDDLALQGGLGMDALRWH